VTWCNASGDGECAAAVRGGLPRCPEECPYPRSGEGFTGFGRPPEGIPEHRYPAPRAHRSRRDPDWQDLGATEDGYRVSGSGDGTVERQHARLSEPTWTIGDALSFLHPEPPRRTLSRWLAALTPVGERTLPQGGPPARTYPAKDVMRAHAAWVRRAGHNS
jgi:hypothetical protein